MLSADDVACIRSAEVFNRGHQFIESHVLLCDAILREDTLLFTHRSVLVTCEFCQCSTPTSSCVSDGERNFCSKDCCAKVRL